MGGGEGEGSGDGSGSSGTVSPVAEVEVEFAGAKTSVWWDIENCQVPRSCDPHNIARNISRALANMGYKGMVSSIYAYGDTNKITPAVQKALNSTGVNLNHVPAGVKDASDKKILVDMLFWAVDNPAPANYLLISGDRDFSNALHQLGMRRYNILLAHAPNVSQALVAAAKCVWLWSSLLAGEPPLNTESRQSKGKQVWKNANNVKQPIVGTQDQINGSSDQFSSKVKHPMQQANRVSASTTSTSEVQDTAQTNHMGNFSVTSAPSKVPSEPVYLQRNSSVETNMFEAPYRFYGADEPNAFSGPMKNPSPPLPDSSLNNGNMNPNNIQARPPQLLRPSDLLHTQPGSTPGNLPGSNSFRGSYPQTPRPNGPPFTSFPSKSIPDINKLNVSEYPGGVQNITSPYQQGPEPRPNFISSPSGVQRNTHPSHNMVASCPPRSEYMPPPPPPPLPTFNINSNNSGVWGIPGCPLPSNEVQRNTHPSHSMVGPCPPRSEYMPPPPPTFNINSNNSGVWGMPGCPQPSNEVQSHIGNILRALNILKNDKMTPTEENIADCIHYGEINLPNFNVRLGLDCAIGHQMVMRHIIGSSLPLYVGQKDRLWKCVNIMDANAKHPKATWDAIRGYLSSPDGRSKISVSRCRYQAASIIKNGCLKDLALGEVCQILHLVINVKKWIIPHPSGWQPLSIKSPVSSSSNVGLRT